MKRRFFLQGTASIGAFAGLGVSTANMAQAAGTVTIGVPIPMSGPGGMFGPPCKTCAEIARDEINARGGLGGRQIELKYIDAGTSPSQAAQDALKAWKAGGVEAFVGFHDSAVRGALVSVFDGKIPYIYTSVYEGGECAPGIQILGETPTQQLEPVIPWLANDRKISKWYLIGNDYNWPRDTNALAKGYIASTGGTVVGEEYVPFSVDNFDSNVAKIKESGADAVLITLVGGSSIGFNRVFASFGLDETVVRLSTGIEELTLAGIGAENSADIYASAGYFNVIDTEGAKDFTARYRERRGSLGDLSFLSESVYEGLLLLEALVNKAGSIDIAPIEAAGEGTTFTGARGVMTLHDRHVTQNIYLAKADGTDFGIVATFDAVGAGDNC